MNASHTHTKPVMIYSCTEDHAAMTPVEGGRHCNSCEKTVFDLRGKSTVEIQSILDVNNGQICGAITNDQVRADSPGIAQWQGIKLMRRFALCIFAVFGSFLFTLSSAMAMSTAQQVQTLGYEGIANRTEESYVLTGVVHDETYGDRMPFATVVLYLDSVEIMGTTTDLQGNYQLEVSALSTEDWQNARLVFTCVGYNTIVIDKFSFGTEKYAYMETSMIFQAIKMPEFEVVAYEVPLIDGGRSSVGVIYSIRDLERLSGGARIPNTDRSVDVVDF